MSEADKAKAQLVIVTGLVVIHFIFGFDHPYLLYAAAIIGIVSIAIPFLGDLIVKGWYKLAEILGAINGRILLSIIFFVILFPIAVLSRIGKKNKNPLALKKESQASAFSERNHLYTPKDLDQVW